MQAGWVCGGASDAVASHETTVEVRVAHLTLDELEVLVEQQAQLACGVCGECDHETEVELIAETPAETELVFRYLEIHGGLPDTVVRYTITEDGRRAIGRVA